MTAIIKVGVRAPDGVAIIAEGRADVSSDSGELNEASGMSTASGSRRIWGKSEGQVTAGSAGLHPDEIAAKFG